MKKSSGSIMVTTLMCCSILSIICLGCLGLTNSHNEINDINYKSTAMKYTLKGGSELVYSKIFEEVKTAIELSGISQDQKQSYKDYFLGDNKYNFISNIENIKEDDVEVNVVDDKLYLENEYIRLDVTYKKEVEGMKKSYICSYKIDTNINRDEINLENIVKKYNYREI